MAAGAAEVIHVVMAARAMNDGDDGGERGGGDAGGDGGGSGGKGGGDGICGRHGDEGDTVIFFVAMARRWRWGPQRRWR